MASLQRTARAEEDLVAIWLYVARDDPTAADRLLDTLDEQSRLLATTPEMGPARDDIAPGLRYFPYRNYLILYQCIEDGVRIVRYVQGARNLFKMTFATDD